MGTALLFFSDRRLAGLFRRAALQHIRRDLAETEATLKAAGILVESSPRLEQALPFVREWAEAIEKERRGMRPPASSAAWIPLGQELAFLLENGGDWAGYLGSRWRLESPHNNWKPRVGYAVLGVLALMLCAFILFHFSRHGSGGFAGNLPGEGGAYALKGRVLAFFFVLGHAAGLVLIFEQGLRWILRALRQRPEEQKVLFLGRPEGLAEAPRDWVKE